MRPIDYENWPRREIFEFFSAISQPFYSVTFRIDVTRLYDHVKPRGLSFYYALIWLCTRAMNSVGAFRVAIEGGKPVLLDKRAPSFTDMKKGAESFHIVTMPAEMGTLEEFCRAAAEKSRSQQSFIDPAAESRELIYFSCLPWVDITALTNERDFDKDDSTPRVAWGRYVEENGRKTLGLSLEVNHRLIDGLHIGRFAQELERLISELN